MGYSEEIRRRTKEGLTERADRLEDEIRWIENRLEKSYDRRLASDVMIKRTRLSMLRRQIDVM